MAVIACFGIIAKIRIPLRIPKGKSTRTDDKAYGDNHCNTKNRKRLFLLVVFQKYPPIEFILASTLKMRRYNT